MVVTPRFFWQAGLNTVHLKTIELLTQPWPRWCPWGGTPARLINSLPCPTFAKSPIESLGIFEIVPPSYAGRRP
jgi:hypothetical protein